MRVVIVGAGGFGREVHDIIDACVAQGEAFEFVGFLDDGMVDESLLARRGARHLGPSAYLSEMDVAFLIGIASPSARRSIDELAGSRGRVPMSVAHPSATQGLDNRIGPGAILCAGARMTTHITVGRHLHLHVNATIGHDCVIGDYVTISPAATISGNVTLGDAVTVGTGANVIQGVTIGDGATVGAGAVVLGDLPPGVTAVGVPAKPLPRSPKQR